MANTAGKLGFLCVACMSFSMLCAAPRLDLQMLSMDGDALQYGVVGEPFVLEVVVSGAQVVQRPHIDGLGAFTVKSSGVTTFSANGATTTTYRYVLRIDTAGTYQVGPAHVVIEGSDVESGRLTIRVLDQNAPELQAQRTREKAEPALVRLSFDVDHAVVGQRVICTLQLYNMPNKAVFEQIFEPDFQSFKVGTRSGPIEKVEEINGVRYQMRQLSWQLYPTKAGRLVIPAVGADYVVQTRGHGFSIFMHHAERRRAYSRAAFLSVDPIETTEKLFGVGRFEHFQAHINPSVANLQEGMVMTLEITGDGDLENADFPELKGMPDALRWYTSKRTTHPDQQDGMNTASYEYIVQGMRAGELVIPPQEITVFDVRSGRVKKLETTSLPVTIMPGQQGPAARDDDARGVVAEKPQHVESEKAGAQLMALHPWDGGLGPRPQRGMPMMLFFVLVFIALACAARDFVRRMIYMVLSLFQKPFDERRIHQALDQACAEKKPDQMYQIFMNFLAHEIGVSPAYLSPSVIENYVRSRGVKEDEKTAWDEFLLQLSQAAFAHIDPAVCVALCVQAQQWLVRLKRGR